MKKSTKVNGEGEQRDRKIQCFIAFLSISLRLSDDTKITKYNDTFITFFIHLSVLVGYLEMVYIFGLQNKYKSYLILMRFFFYFPFSIALRAIFFVLFLLVLLFQQLHHMTS